MLTEEDFDLFRQFRIKAMGDRLREMIDDPECDDMAFEERIKILLDAEQSARHGRKVAKLAREAGFKLPAACVEDIVYLPERKLSRDRVARLAECRWVERAEVVLFISKTGCGKSFLCQALGNAACRKLIPTRYMRLADVFDRLNRSRAFDVASYYSLMDDLKSVQLLILDDFLTTPISTQNAVDLFEILEGRHEKAATLIASQLEPHEWYLRIEGESMADSILGRVASAARRYDLDGPDMRRYFAQNMPEL